MAQRKVAESDIDREEIAKRLRDQNMRISQFKSAGKGLRLNYDNGPRRHGSAPPKPQARQADVADEPRDAPTGNGGDKVVKLRDLVSRVLMDLEDHDAPGAARYRKELRGIA